MKTWKIVLTISALILFAVWAADYMRGKTTPQEPTTQVQAVETAVQEQAETIRENRVANTKQIRKAVKQAVETADNISSSDICAEFNTVISGARERNAKRRCADSADN